MNKEEALQFLALVKLAYPTAYRYTDADTAKKEALATANMWQMAFADVPYPIFEQAFNHFKMVSKFPPTIAEMREELKNIYNQAVEGALIHKGLGNQEMVDKFKMVMAYTAKYKNTDNLGGLNISTLPRLGGGEYVGITGSPRDNLD